jgi:hypothetical protein
MANLFTGQPQNVNLTIGGSDVAAANAIPTAAAKETATTSASLAAAQVLKSAAGILYEASCELDPSAPSGTYYVLVVDAATQPANGAVTLLRAVAVDHQQGIRDYVRIRAEQGGIAVTVGATVCLSSSRPTLTAAGAYLWVDGGVG